MSPKPQIEIVKPIEIVNPLFLKTGGNLRGAQIQILQVNGVAAAIRPQQLIRLVTGTPDEPVGFGVQFDAVPNDSVPNAIIAPRPRMRALIKWGWEAGGHQALIDLIRGCTIGVNGSFLDVSVFALPIIFSGNMTVSATAAPGRPSTGSRPTLTLSNLDVNVPPVIAPAGEFIVPVPAYAKTFRVTRIPESSAIGVQIRNTPAQVLFDTAVAPFSIPQDIVLPAGADDVRIVNNSAVNLTVASVIFGIDL